jgi:hypothetical protein
MSFSELNTDGCTVEPRQSTALENAVHDGIGEVVIVQDGTPALRVLVGGEEWPANRTTRAEQSPAGPPDGSIDPR